jgi:hypothetical protein
MRRSSSGWLSLGFNENASTTEKFTSGGVGSVFLRDSGDFEWREGLGGGGVNVTGSVSNPDQFHAFKLVLDTTETEWRMDLFVDGGQIDLGDGGAVGKSHVWSSNPTIGSVQLSWHGGDDGVTGYGDMSLMLISEPATIIPEPLSALAVMLGAGALARYVRRRRS